jgi:hypothetical protein
LQPPPHLLALQLPEYEKRVDHAGMIRALDKKSLDRGEAIYYRNCINCHGTPGQAGSLPTALPFWSGKFKNGSDPHAMYETLTRGAGMMTPQSWMVPQQKYDVIHFIREEYLKNGNKSQYAGVSDAYLAGLPRGDTRGPDPKPLTPWSDMDYGPSLTNVYEFGNDGSNLAYKGIAVRVDANNGTGTPGGITRGGHWMVFDHDTFRLAGAWHGQSFIDYAGIQFDGQHVVHAHTSGEIDFQNLPGPGWARPADGSFDDPRIKGTDGKKYGPLPREWAKFRGVYHHGEQVVISYTVGETEVLEMPGLAASGPAAAYTRTFNIGPRQQDLMLQIANVASTEMKISELGGQRIVATNYSKQANTTRAIVAGVAPAIVSTESLSQRDGSLRLRIPKGTKPLRMTMWLGTADNEADIKKLETIQPVQPDRDLTSLTKGGPPRWPQRLTTQSVIGGASGPFAVDTLTHPINNPWQAQLRFTGLDFLPGGDQVAVCTWDGDVWLVSGLRKPQLVWQRIASGLFQPLGLKVINGRVFVTCRDQIVVLNDLNGDGEADFYECFNNDQQVTAHFHEFAMGLQTDKDGNLYYAKAACHARPFLVPQHGTLLRVSPDGLKTEILACGFRAPNGVCLNADGSFFITDQEGHWLPKNRINRVVPGKFYGNMLGSGAPKDKSDAAMEQPVCWITNAFDRSPAEMLWVDGADWGNLRRSLLNLSYGYGKIYIVPHEEVDGAWQGGMCELPMPALPTGVIRGRFNPHDGQLYVCGMYAWAGSMTQPGGFYRIRATGKPAHLPVELKARPQNMKITLSDPLDAASVADVKNYGVRVWSLKRTANYGSQHHNEHALKVTAARLAADGRTIELTIPQLAPTWCMEITYDLKSKDGRPVAGKIHNTIHKLGTN